MMNKNLISIVIVNYNGWRDTIECIRSLERQTYKNIEIIVVDNGSVDDDKTNFGRLTCKVPIMFIYNKTNVGFGNGCNLGLNSAEGSFIALINNDMVADPCWIEELLGVFQASNRVGIAGGKVYQYNTELKKSILDSAGSQFNQIGQAWSTGFLEKDHGQYGKKKEVAMITAGACLIRRSLIDDTLFDPTFFMYMEELDLCLRIRTDGFKVIYNPNAFVFHKFSQSVQKSHKNALLFKIFHSNIARAKILLKYYSIEILVKNLHLILISFLVNDFYVLKNGGIKKLYDFKIKQFKFAIEGLKERKAKSNWAEWITYQSLKELIKGRSAGLNG